ncbi:hypothetical protein F5X68DRAFT_62414 [Plectosphaerella plurivora]|uniref:Uncharacterized protein n=1 Tax=Plectosphaerella plurivora TaxID=936078 RepID=A0A9P9A4R9_9PEZI|nr:hypothetical protein F5X68DRAFT_62414 [Plectosphaerella plurivora]
MRRVHVTGKTGFSPGRGAESSGQSSSLVMMSSCSREISPLPKCLLTAKDTTAKAYRGFKPVSLLSQIVAALPSSPACPESYDREIYFHPFFCRPFPGELDPDRPGPGRSRLLYLASLIEPVVGDRNELFMGDTRLAEPPSQGHPDRPSRKKSSCDLASSPHGDCPSQADAPRTTATTRRVLIASPRHPTLPASRKRAMLIAPGFNQSSSHLAPLPGDPSTNVGIMRGKKKTPKPPDPLESIFARGDGISKHNIKASKPNPPPARPAPRHPVVARDLG